MDNRTKQDAPSWLLSPQRLPSPPSTALGFFSQMLGVCGTFKVQSGRICPSLPPGTVRCICDSFKQPRLFHKVTGSCTEVLYGINIQTQRARHPSASPGCCRRERGPFSRGPSSPGSAAGPTGGQTCPTVLTPDSATMYPGLWCGTRKPPGSQRGRTEMGAVRGVEWMSV